MTSDITFDVSKVIPFAKMFPLHWIAEAIKVEVEGMKAHGEGHDFTYTEFDYMGKANELLQLASQMQECVNELSTVKRKCIFCEEMFDEREMYAMAYDGGYFCKKCDEEKRSLSKDQ